MVGEVGVIVAVVVVVAVVTVFAVLVVAGVVFSLLIVREKCYLVQSIPGKHFLQTKHL